MDGSCHWLPVTFSQIADGGDLEPKMFGLITKFNKMHKNSINNETPAIGNVLLADGAYTYWVIEWLLNNQVVYWTGNIPHLSIQQSEAGLQMWTANIHEAQKMQTKEEADINNDDFQVCGVVAEHMDI